MSKTNNNSIEELNLCHYCKSKLNIDAKVCAVCGRDQNWIKEKILNPLIFSGLLPIVVAVVITLLTFYFIQNPHDEELNLIAQKYVHYNAVVQKQMEYAEKLIADRQHTLVIINRIINSRNLNERNQQINELKKLNSNAQIDNSLSLIYLYQPTYDAVMHFDSLLTETSLGIFANKISKEQLINNRKELGRRLDEIINIARVNIINDTVYFSIRNKILEIK